jgi:hypothetical protein
VERPASWDCTPIPFATAQEKSDLVEYLKALFSNGSAVVES